MTRSLAIHLTGSSAMVADPKSIFCGCWMLGDSATSLQWFDVHRIC